MGAFVVDVFAFCKKGEQAQGSYSVSELKRLAADTVDQLGAIDWSVVGRVNALGYPELVLSVSGKVSLACQRCLSGLLCDVASESVIVIAEDEDTADKIDALLEDDDVDVIVGSTTFDMQYLIEDEVLLALPFAPKHDVCPGDVAFEEAAHEDKASPFTVLKNIQHKQ